MTPRVSPNKKRERQGSLSGGFDFEIGEFRNAIRLGPEPNFAGLGKRQILSFNNHLAVKSNSKV
jgi:hypothetical protein